MTKTQYDRFQKLLAARGWEGQPASKTPCEYAAAFYLLSCSKSIFEQALPHVSRAGIDFALLLELGPRDYDYDHYADLVRLAANLFWSRPVEGLDCSQFGNMGAEYAATAIMIRACGASVLFEERSL